VSEAIEAAVVEEDSPGSAFPALAVKAKRLIELRAKRDDIEAEEKETMAEMQAERPPTLKGLVIKEGKVRFRVRMSWSPLSVQEISELLGEDGAAPFIITTVDMQKLKEKYGEGFLQGAGSEARETPYVMVVVERKKAKTKRVQIDEGAAELSASNTAPAGSRAE
jgi:DNA-binding Lrp family transcriptional regulator